MMGIMNLMGDVINVMQVVPHVLIAVFASHVLQVILMELMGTLEPANLVLLVVLPVRMHLHVLLVKFLTV